MQITTCKISHGDKVMFNKKIQYQTFTGKRFKNFGDEAKKITEEIAYEAERAFKEFSEETEKVKKGFFAKISDFFSSSSKKPSKKTSLEPQLKNTFVKNEPPIVPPKPKFELPKPNFKYDKTNPVEFAKEKDAYMRNAINYIFADEKSAQVAAKYFKNDKFLKEGYAYDPEKIALNVMEQFDQYGSNELLMELLTSICCITNKTEKIANKYLQLYDKFAKKEPDIEKILTSPLSAILEDYGNVLSTDSIKLIIQGFKKAGEHPGDLLDVRGFIKGDRHYHSFFIKI